MGRSFPIRSDGLVGKLLKIQPRTLASVGVAVLLALLGIWLRSDSSPPGERLVHASYDWSHTLTSPWTPSLDDSPVVLVYLDFESYQAERQHIGEPWDRRLHARLINRLGQAGAKAIVFDIIFDAAGDAGADQELARAIRANGRVFLAAEVNQTARDTKTEPGLRTQSLTLPHLEFRNAAAGTGLANLIPDDDFVVRRYFARSKAHELPSMSLAVAEHLRLPSSAKDNETSWLRYYGRALTVPHVSYTHALDPAGVGDDFFRGKIVFVGARPLTGGYAERRDEFRNPFPSWRRDLFMPAVEIHATQMINLARGDFLRRLSPGAEGLLLGLTALLFGVGLFRFHPWPAAGAALVGEAALIAAATAGFAYGHIWFPWLIVGAVQIPVALGGSVLFHSIEWYVTRRRLEAQQRSDEAKIREQAALIDKAQDAILLQDLDGRIVYANPGATRLYGWSAGEFPQGGVTDQLFAPCAAKVAEAGQRVRERGEWQGELEQATKQGARLLVESRWTLIRDDQGQPKNILLINTDITEKKRLEQQFLRAQRLDAIGSLAGGMAHDLNNALSPVLMGIQRLRKKAQDEDSQRMLAVMESNTHRGADMVKHVLTFSRGHGEEKERLDPGRLLREMEHIAAQTFPKNIRLSVLAPRDVWPVLGNATQLHQVLLNLAVNARDAMPAGGELTLAADNVELTEAEAREIPNGVPGPFVMLLVADTGTGIAPEILPRLFEPFFTTKAPGHGTGLGLSTTAHIVRSHGGFVNIRSEVGAGTTFEIYLPRATTPTAAPEAAPVAELPRGHGECILLIDDETALLEMLAATLEEHGYRALTAPGGAEGLALAAPQWHSIQMVIVDMGMPLMDGRQVLEAIRQRQPALPVLLTSGEAGLPAGMKLDASTQFLPKPFDMSALLNAIHRGLHRRS